MDKACETVLLHKISVHLAADFYGGEEVRSSQTYFEWLSIWKVPVQAKSGRKAYLTDEEEDCLLVGWLNFWLGVH